MLDRLTHTHPLLSLLLHQVVLAGLDVLLPLLTPELLAAATTAAGGGDGGGGGGPGAGGKLARLLFSLLAYMMEVHTQAVSVHGGGVHGDLVRVTGHLSQGCKPLYSGLHEY